MTQKCNRTKLLLNLHLRLSTPILEISKVSMYTLNLNKLNPDKWYLTHRCYNFSIRSAFLLTYRICKGVAHSNYWSINKCKPFMESVLTLKSSKIIDILSKTSTILKFDKKFGISQMQSNLWWLLNVLLIVEGQMAAQKLDRSSNCHRLRHRQVDPNSCVQISE